MIKFFTKRMNNKKGFTLIELIVVIAILGILAAIAIPRFAGVRITSAVKADGSTARSIISAARIQETETGIKLDDLDDLDSNYMPSAESATDATFELSGGGTDNYVVTFTPSGDFSPYNQEQTVTENDGTWNPKK